MGLSMEPPSRLRGRPTPGDLVSAGAGPAPDRGTRGLEAIRPNGVSDLSSALDSSLRAALGKGRLDIPLLPESASQVVALAGDPDCEARDLIAVVKRDQSLMAHLMRVANSVLLAPEVPIVSLQLAVSRLGLSRVRDIAVAAALKSRVFAPGRHAELVRRLFRLALATGFYSQEVARLRRKNVEQAFLAGLLRDIAAPAICELIGESEVEADEILAALAEFVPAASAEMIESWRLPAGLAAVARFAATPELAGAAADLCRAVRLAHGLALEVLEPERATDMEDDAAALNLYQDDLARLRERRDFVLALVESSA